MGASHPPTAAGAMVGSRSTSFPTLPTCGKSHCFSPQPRVSPSCWQLMLKAPLGMPKFSACQMDIISVVQVETDILFFLNTWLKDIVLLNWIKTWKQQNGKTTENLWKHMHCLIFWCAMQMKTATFFSNYLHICKWLQGSVEGGQLDSIKEKGKRLLLWISFYNLEQADILNLFMEFLKMSEVLHNEAQAQTCVSNRIIKNTHVYSYSNN